MPESSVEGSQSTAERDEPRLRESDPALCADPDVCAILANIRQVHQSLALGQAPQLMGIVSGSASAASYWSVILEARKQSLGTGTIVSLHEDLPVNQALGLLLLWHRVRAMWREDCGALFAFVFGEGTRIAPFTEAECGQKPAISTFVRASLLPGSAIKQAAPDPAEMTASMPSKVESVAPIPVGSPPSDAQGEESHPMLGPPMSEPFVSAVELAMRCFVPVEQFLRRSGFRGIVVKWGDDVQIPVRDMAGKAPHLQDADVVRFVSMQVITPEHAENKDWLGVDAEGQVIAFIPRRPLAEMHALADRGWMRREGRDLYGGINLGSVAMSAMLLDVLWEEFGAEVLRKDALRSERPDFDPQFFWAMTVARIEDDALRTLAIEEGRRDNPATAALLAHMPEIVERLRRAFARFVLRHGRPVKIVALDFGGQYWADIGQHGELFDAFHQLRDLGAKGHVARAIAGIEASPDASGNWLVGNCRIGRDVRVTNSVLIDVHIDKGVIVDSVLVGTATPEMHAHHALDVHSVARSLSLRPRAVSYKVLSDEPQTVGEKERLTTVQTDEGPTLVRGHESLDMRDRKSSYMACVMGNCLSFDALHRLVSAQSPTESMAVLRSHREELLQRLFPEDHPGDHPRAG